MFYVVIDCSNQIFWIRPKDWVEGLQEQRPWKKKTKKKPGLPSGDTASVTKFTYWTIHDRHSTFPTQRGKPIKCFV